MPLLGRELSPRERAIAGSLKTALTRPCRAADRGDTVSRIAAAAPREFCLAALSLLDAAADPSARKSLYQQLIECPEFLILLMQSDCFSRDPLVGICRELMTLDNTFDVRLARLTPSRWETESPLDGNHVVLVLDILNEISPGGRLVLLLNHLTQHPDRHVASKATLMIGKRLRNQDWLKRQLDSSDGRVRANVLEGLWDVSTPASRRALWRGLKDKDNRVVGNALIGLHQLGERTVHEFVKRMIEDERPPFRWTAAWVMGKIGGDEFVGCLERALQDKEAQVRRAAERALKAIRPPLAEAPPEPGPEPAVATETRLAETPRPDVAPPAKKPPETPPPGDQAAVENSNSA